MPFLTRAILMVKIKRIWYNKIVYYYINNMPKNKETENFEEDLKNIEDIENQEENNAFDYGDILASWEFPEFEKHERNKLWYVAFVAVFLAMIIYAYFSKNLLFAIILAIFAILYFTSLKNDPLTMETAITEDGIFIGSKFIPYEEILNFYIIYYPPEIKNIYFQPKSMLKHRITIPLEDQNPIYLREVLLNYLTEDIEKEEIPASEGISKILKL